MIEFDSCYYLKQLIEKKGESFFCKKADYEITLPTPVSVNSAYSNSRRGRIKTVKNKQWQSIAQGAILSKPRPNLNSPIAIFHHLFVPDRRKRDCANYEKVSTDLLVDMQVIKDDSLIRLNQQQWVDWEKRDKVVFIQIFKIDSN